MQGNKLETLPNSINRDMNLDNSIAMHSQFKPQQIASIQRKLDDSSLDELMLGAFPN